MLPFEYVCHPPPPSLRIAPPPPSFPPGASSSTKRRRSGWRKKGLLSSKNFPRRGKSTRPQCHHRGRGSTIFHLVSRCRTDSPFPFARKGERERKRRDVAKNIVGIFRTPVISRERGYRFFHRSFPRLLFCSCICPSLKADFSISIFGGEEGREEGSSRVNFVQEDEDEVFFFSVFARPPTGEGELRCSKKMRR